MVYTISNDNLKASFKLIGAELCSLIDIQTGTEFMWEGNPTFWKGQSPILFPIIGALKNGEYLYQGKKYTLPNHGLVRNNSSIELKKQNTDSISFSYCYNQETLKHYPFEFELTTTYILKEKTLIIKHEVYNKGEDKMLFSLGAHPAFKCPVKEDEQYSDYHLEFEEPETLNRWMLANDGLIDIQSQSFMNNENTIALHDKIFDNGAIVLKDIKSTSINLVNKQNQNVLKVSFKGFNYMGIWAKPGAPFVCIEPWLGIADSVNTNQQFEEKEGILSLNPSNKFKVNYSITLFPDN